MHYCKNMKDKIDVVITYVNMEDEIWQEQFIREKTSYTGNENAIDVSRFRDWGTLKFVLRSIDKYAPFVNNIFLVVQMESQVPEWINRKTMNVVLHEEFMPAEVLPTYSSCAIEMYLHLIPGLSEKFIYFNDDMILWNRHRPEDFFIGDKCVNSLSLNEPDKLVEKEKTFTKLYRYINLISTTIPYDVLNIPRDYGYTINHNPSSFFKSINNELYSKMINIIKSKSYRFRCKDSLTQYMYITYSIISKKCINVGSMSPTNILSWTKDRKRFKSIFEYLNSNHKQICLNDTQFDNITEDILISIRDIINTLSIKFNKPCKYERYESCVSPDN